MDESREAQVSAVAALEEPTRRRLYDHVARRSAPVTRDEAASACELPRATAAFHLDRLAAEGLLDVVYERRTGRSGPGAGRPAKLYRRSGRRVAVSLPERRYELAARLLAAAVADTEHTGDAARTALDRRAYEMGELLGTEQLARQDEPAGADATGTGEAESVVQVLEEYDFEPRAEGSGLVLGNCPFHTLAAEHPELVCGMNRHLLDGMLAGLGVTELRARLEPAPGHCCVRIGQAGT